MKNLRHYVGTPSAIIAFEAAGRHLNFTKAADELNVSQPAISRQIRNLELHIGEPLFLRRGNIVQFTENGLMLYNATNSSFENIIAAIDRIINEPRAETLILRSQPVILSTFVLPLLVDLQRAFPDISIDLQALDNTAVIENERTTISILYGDGHWQGMESALLFNDVYFPVCHPLALKNLIDTESESIFDQLPLLQMSKFIDPWMEWHKWGMHFGIDSLSTRQPFTINDYEMLLRACRLGHGVAIGALYLVDRALREGSLVRVTDLIVNSKFGFYFVYHPALIKKRDHANILSWLRLRAEKTQQRCLTLLNDAQVNGDTVFQASNY